jgi:hypothetical protein
MNRAALLALALLAPCAWAQAPPPPSIDSAPAAATPEPAAAKPAATASPAPPAVDRQGRIAELLETHIEEVRRGNRVTEVRVTGPDGVLRYTIENRDQRPPSALHGSGSGLSAPNFLNLEF